MNKAPALKFEYCFSYKYVQQMLLFYHSPLHFTPLHSTSLHSTSLHSTLLHFTSLHSTPLHYTPPHSTPLHFTSLQPTPLHFTPLHSTHLILIITLHMESIALLREQNSLLTTQNALLRAKSEGWLLRLERLEDKLTSLLEVVTKQSSEILKLKLLLFVDSESD